MDSLVQPMQKTSCSALRHTQSGTPIKSKSTSSRSRPSSLSSDRSSLRRKLSSFAWVQCDNIKCLKWRKISSTVAKNLSHAKWTCCMNGDPDYQSCSVPEEDTALFDRLAKKARLDLIKSEIEKGSLVWAKMDGYCRWPALITDDPACNLHADGDEEEILWYHVEFLGSERSHGWVRTERVEVFGTNFDKLDSKEASTANAQNIVSSRRKKGKGKRNIVKGGKLKKTYKGGSTVQIAISEALSLLPLPLDDRIKTCRFVSEDSGLKNSPLTSEQKNGKRKDVNCVSSSNKKKPVPRKAKICANEPNKFSVWDNQIKRKSERIRNESIRNISKKVFKYEGVCEGDHQHATKACKSESFKNNAGNTYSLLQPPKGLRCLNFSSSLIDISKEERFMLDVQMYQRNEKVFEDDVKSFMASHGLGLSAPPVWQHVKVNIFSIFLAVYERGGYDLVCENHQWAQVYAEVTHQQTKQGSSIVKKFYKRNIYAYELFATGQDCKLAVMSLQQEHKQKKIQASSIDSKASTFVSVETKLEDSEESSSVISEYLNSLDEILQALGSQEKGTAQQVPHLNQISGLNCLHSLESIEDLAYTASITGKALEPEESAQVVPELDFPSSMESSDQGSDLQGFHEMQALQLHVDELDNQINDF